MAVSCHQLKITTTNPNVILIFVKLLCISFCFTFILTHSISNPLPLKPSPPLGLISIRHLCTSFQLIALLIRTLSVYRLYIIQHISGAQVNRDRWWRQTQSNQSIRTVYFSAAHPHNSLFNTNTQPHTLMKTNVSARQVYKVDIPLPMSPSLLSFPLISPYMNVLTS